PGAPAGEVHVVGPAEKRRARRVPREVAVIEHRIDQDLARQSDPAIARDDCRGGGNAPASAVAHDRDPLRTYPELGRLVAQPGDGGVHVLRGPWARRLGSQAIVDREKWHPGSGDVL